MSKSKLVSPPDLHLIPGSSNPSLCYQLAPLLQAKVADIDISKFPNGEKRIWIKSNLQNSVAIILQSFSEPVDEHIIELALIADACKHAKSHLVLAVVPWLGYSPQDKEFRKGEPVSVHVIAKIIEAMSVDHLLTVDIHSRESLSYFTIPTTEISALPLFTEYFQSQSLKNYVVASLDKGALEDSQKFAQKLNLPLVVFEKHRDLYTGEVELKHISGEVKNKHVIAIDDFVSTGSTRITASRILKSLGAKFYIDCITHPLLALDSASKLQLSQIDRVIVTDTYHVPPEKIFPKLTILPIAPLLSQAIKSLIDAHLSKTL